MNQVQQAVIAAGGKGSRLSPKNNPNGSKVLIEYAGKTLFEHLLNSLIEGGVKKFIISTGYHTDRKIREIIKFKNINAIVIPISECESFRWIPYFVQDILDERFIFMCGHQPLNPQFVKKMLNASKKNKYVAASYKGNLYKQERAANMKIIYNNKSKKILSDKIKFDTKKLSEKLFIDSPYIITKDIVLEFNDKNGQGEYSSYILSRFKKGESLTIIESPTPPEFDYDEEFCRTIQNLA